MDEEDETPRTTTTNRLGRKIASAGRYKEKPIPKGGSKKGESRGFFQPPFVIPQPSPTDPWTIEKILGWRMMAASRRQEGDGGVEEEQPEEEFYCIKWKERSYLHTSWEKGSELISFDLNADQKIKRWEQKQVMLRGPAWKQEPKDLEEDEQLYEPEMSDVQRVIGCAESHPPLDPIVRQLKKLKRLREVRIPMFIRVNSYIHKPCRKGPLREMDLLLVMEFTNFRMFCWVW